MAIHINPGQSDDTDFYEVIIMGGALSGGATATPLLRQNPGIRILILEKRPAVAPYQVPKRQRFNKRESNR
jgi:2-polyprenyl-6-methoxyphenol hydroxylase-like FAD-dependent oxidoreductase